MLAFVFPLGVFDELMSFLGVFFDLGSLRGVDGADLTSLGDVDGSDLDSLYGVDGPDLASLRGVDGAAGSGLASPCSVFPLIRLLSVMLMALLSVVLMGLLDSPEMLG